MALSSSTPNGAPRGDFFGLLRAASCRRRAQAAHGWPGVGSGQFARSPRFAREFMTYLEPVPRGRCAAGV